MNSLLTDARVITPDGVLEQGTISISDGLIHRIDLQSSNAAKGSHVIDCRGLTVFPGFIDVHIHGAKGIDTLEASADDLLSVSRFLATQGVTAWVPTLVPAVTDQYEAATRAIEKAVGRQTVTQSQEDQDEPGGARVLGVHYEGPFVNEAQCGALRREYFRTFSDAGDVDQLPLPGHVGGIKMMTLAPEVSGGVELIVELIKRGWIVSLGHTRADVQTLDRAQIAGARHMTHFMNAMAPLHHRAPGPIAWGLLHDDVTCDFIADGIHLDELILKLLLRTKGADHLSLISDSIAPTGMGDGSYRIWGEMIEVKDGRTSNARGSIAGSVISMLDAVRKMRSLGASDVELARMGATNPAKLLRIDDECGAIETGKRADLVALDGNGTVKLTIVGGVIAYSEL
jgi:N-acetylglucosamine-6-phosphate deacetylase